MEIILYSISSIIIIGALWYCFENYNIKVAFVTDYVILMIRYLIINGTNDFIDTAMGTLIIASLSTLLFRFIYNRTNSFWKFFFISSVLYILVFFLFGFLFALPVVILTSRISGSIN